jgi:DUF1680 family protein
MKKLILIFYAFTGLINLYAQEKLYKNTFPLSDVKLLKGTFKHSCDLNMNVLLEYDADRFLAPFLREAGLSSRKPSYDNWESSGLDGHTGGHYLTALALNYAATGNEECKRRMDYMVSELKRCQRNSLNGKGYIGGVPVIKELDGVKQNLWEEIKQGNTGIIWKYWVPWYNLHKTYAGLRDAYIYGGNKDAKEMFLNLCNWGISVISCLDDKQMEAMLANEFGGMNEVYADAYSISGDKKYLDAAKRFSHKDIFDNMKQNIDNLDNKHANTQVPKAVGYERIAELTGDADYRIAAAFFWDRVANHRSLSFGGNSRREHFPSKDDCISYTEEREGPESCNTYNMLKLTSGLFRMNPKAKYADYYERAMFNHILSTQHPEHGGYVYFTPARPAHYRVYSTPNNAMWCCVGTGMENHGKYGEFIYTHSGDSLYVNLFVASELDWKEKGITLIQNTRFPEEEGSKLTVKLKKTSEFTLLVRCPWWVESGKMQIICNSKNYAANALPSSYVAISRKWKDGDIVEIKMPMKITIEKIPNVTQYISIMRGPILLGAKTGTENMTGLLADDGRWAHIAHGSLVSVLNTPIIVGTQEEIVLKLKKMKPVAGKPFSFTVPGLFRDVAYKDLVLEPFYNIHDSRYIIYWLGITQQEYDKILEHKREKESRKLILDSRTIDRVNIGEQQPEADHLMKQKNTQTGIHKEEAWRNARTGGYFQYELKTAGQEDLSLLLRYWGNETGSRTFDILIDDQLLTTENIVGKWNKEDFTDVEYPIPSGMLKSKEYITVKFLPKKDNDGGRIFNVRLLRSNAGEISK